MSEKAGVGSGLAVITLAKLYFILTGFAVQVGLPRLLGSPEAFGQYSLAMSIANVVDNVLIAATVQSLSKRVSENEALAPARLRQGLRVQLGIGHRPQARPARAEIIRSFHRAHGAFPLLGLRSSAFQSRGIQNR